MTQAHICLFLPPILSDDLFFRETIGRHEGCLLIPLNLSRYLSFPFILNTLQHGSSNLEMGFPDSSVGKESACKVGYLGSIPGLGRSPWRREDPLEKGMAGHPSILAWRIPWTTVHGVTKS